MNQQEDSSKTNPLWDDLSPATKGMQAGAKQNIDLTNKYVKPLLNVHNFDCCYDRSGFNIREFQPLSDYKNWSKLSKRMTPEKGSGLLSKVFHNTNTAHFVRTQILPIRLWTTDDLENRPRFSIPHEVLEITTVEERIDFMYNFWKAIDLYFFIYAYASKKYSLCRFADFEQECWYTCLRHQPHDRIAMKADCQTTLKPKSISQLEEDLKNILKIK